MKDCPYCEAKISNNAKKCKHCGEIVVEEKKVRQCPYCEAEVSETAKKCKYCGEWLGTNCKGERGNMEQNRYNMDIKEKSIECGKILIICSFVLMIVESLSLFLMSVDSDYIDLVSVLNALFFFILLIVLIVRSVKTYKILLVTNTKNLNFKSTISVGWGRILPIISFVRPYQAVKDILKNLEEKNQLNKSTSIVGWRWSMSLLGSIFSRGLLKAQDEESYMIALVICTFLDLIGLYLLIKIVKRVNNALKVIQ